MYYEELNAGWMEIVREALVEEFGPALGNEYMDEAEEAVDPDVMNGMSIADFVGDVDIYIENS